MTNFTITAETRISSLNGKAGLDTYSVNGGNLILDNDSRYGPNTSISTGPHGDITVSATLGGALTLRSTGVRLIPFSGGNGNAPNAGTQIRQGDSIAELLCVMTARTGGTVVTGQMPATGYLKVRDVSAPFGPGPLQGVNANASGADEPGWIVLVGLDVKTFNIPRLGSLDVEGNWFDVGVTTGSRGQTVQLPHFAADSVTHYPGLEIETAPGSGVYEFWANVGAKFTSAIMSTDSRCKYVNINTAALVTIGRGNDSLDAGELPAAGCRMRVPGLILQNCTTVTKTVNCEPNAAMNTRHECASTSAGVIRHSLSTGAWYWNIVQPYSVEITDLHTCDQIVIAEAATPPVLDRIHVGMSQRATFLAINPIAIQQCYNGGTVGEISGVRAEATSTSGYSVNLFNLYGTWTFKKIRATYASDATAISGPIFFNTCEDVTVDEAWTVGKRLLILSSSRVKVRKHYYADNVKVKTATTITTHAVEMVQQSRACEVLGVINWPGVDNVHPYNGLFYANTAFDCKFRNTGTPESPYNAGTLNPMAYIYADGGNCSGLKIQRNWTTALRTGLSGSTNTTTLHQMENCYSTDATKTLTPTQLNATLRGNRWNAGAVPTTFVGVYGTHFWDAFTSDTTTRAALVFCEKTAYSAAAYTVDSGKPRFTAQGALSMSKDDQVTWTWSHFILGWTGLTTVATTGTNLQNYNIEYDLDKGNGFSGVFKALTDQNLAAETGISAMQGFKPRIRVTCTQTNGTNRLVTLRFDGLTTLAVQNSALYPMDMATLKLTGLTPGSSVAVFAGTPANGQAPVVEAYDSLGSAVLTYPHEEAVASYTLRIRKPGFAPVTLTYANAIVTGIPVSQQENKDGFGVPIYGRGTGGTSGFVGFSPETLRITLGNTRVSGEDAYDTVALWQASNIGMRYPEALRFDGTDFLVLGAWRFRRLNGADVNSGLDALPVVDGQPNLSPDDEIFGSVDFRARSVRTLATGSTVPPEQAIATAVQASLEGTLKNLESKIEDRFYAYRDPTSIYWVLTSGEQTFLGATPHDPRVLNLPDVVFHEMEGQIPDLNFYCWDFVNDAFKCRLETRLSFLTKFTISELASIRASQDGVVKDMLAKWDRDIFVDITAQQTSDTIAYFGTIGLLTPDRVEALSVHLFPH